MVIIQMNANLSQMHIEKTEQLTAASAEQLLEQTGGGQRLPSPPPVEAPTCLQTKVKATDRDTGLVWDAGT